MTTFADESTLSQQLLEAWFASAGVCTTSRVSHIADNGERVIITVEIEEMTRRALTRMSRSDREDWLSLHCPPQIHGIWHQSQPPDDVLVTGALDPSQDMVLSCMDYQRGRWNRRDRSLADRLRRWLEWRADD